MECSKISQVGRALGLAPDILILMGNFLYLVVHNHTALFSFPLPPGVMSQLQTQNFYFSFSLQHTSETGVSVLMSPVGWMGHGGCSWGPGGLCWAVWTGSTDSLALYSGIPQNSPERSQTERSDILSYTVTRTHGSNPG